MLNRNYYYVGQKLDEFKNQPDGNIMLYKGSGAFFLFVLLDQPLKEEIYEFENMNHFEITYSEFVSVGFFGIKVGDKLAWGDCPFSPNVVAKGLKYPKLEDKEGYSLTIILVDTSMGQVKSIRVLGLGHGFSNELSYYLNQSRKNAITKDYYDDVVNYVYRNISTDYIVKSALTYCVLGYKPQLN